ncbi:MAG TPA: YceI family protein [Geobacteraceae bacterium]|nr:YceI family protein [Geobacteraceae bacterium]
MRLSYIIGVLAALITVTAAAQSPSGAVYEIVAAASKIQVGVFREGLLKAFGHDHLIAAKSFTNTVHFNADKVEETSLTLNIEAKSLTVLDPGEAEKDRRDVQATMVSAQVLGVESFPRIMFRSTGVHLIKKAGAEWEVTLAGKLNLHGVEKPITFPVRIRLDNTRLTVRGEVFIAQTDFGIKPVKVAGGTVRVKDRVKVSFTIVAENNKS